MKLAPVVASGRLLQSNKVFLTFFALYTGGVVFLVLLGLFSALAAPDLPLHDALHQAHQHGGALQGVYSGIEVASHSHVTGDRPQVVLDYLLSALNLGFGIFLVWRRPDNWVARLLGLGMVGTATAFNFHSHVAVITTDVLENISTRLHLAVHAISGVTYLHALLLFPNGRLVPRQARPFLIGAYVVMAVEVALSMIVGYAITPFVFGYAMGMWDWITQVQAQFGADFGPADVITRPDLFAAGMQLTFDAEIVFFILFAGILMPVVGVVSQLQRYGTLATAHERQQIKFLLFALALAAIVGVGSLVLALAPWPGLTEQARAERLDMAVHLVPPMFAVIPVALFIAIVRHHLFDIDLIIHRTLVYGALTAGLALTYWGSVVVFQQVLRPLTQGSELAVAISTLVVAALFQPARRQVQLAVDRRFYRGKYDAARTLEAFSAHLRQEVDLDSLSDELVAVAHRTVRPARASLWLRKGAREA